MPSPPTTTNPDAGRVSGSDQCCSRFCLRELFNGDISVLNLLNYLPPTFTKLFWSVFCLVPYILIDNCVATSLPEPAWPGWSGQTYTTQPEVSSDSNNQEQEKANVNISILAKKLSFIQRSDFISNSLGQIGGKNVPVSVSLICVRICAY